MLVTESMFGEMAELHSHFGLYQLPGDNGLLYSFIISGILI